MPGAHSGRRPTAIDRPLSAWLSTICWPQSRARRMDACVVGRRGPRSRAFCLAFPAAGCVNFGVVDAPWRCLLHNAQAFRSASGLTPFCGARALSPTAACADIPPLEPRKPDGQFGCNRRPRTCKPFVGSLPSWCVLSRRRRSYGVAPFPTRTTCSRGLL